MCVCVCCCRLRRGEKKRKKLPIQVKNPVRKKDQKKVMLKTLEEKLAREETPLNPPQLALVTPSPPPSHLTSLQ